jgi:nucleoside-diphosphate-sugar epimerase
MKAVAPVAPVAPIDRRWALIGGHGFIGTRLTEMLMASPQLNITFDVFGRGECPVVLNYSDILFMARPTEEEKDRTLLNILAGIEYRSDVNVVFFSSSAVYGNVVGAKEVSLRQPQTWYGRQKVESENDVVKWCNFGNFLILRISDVYGKMRNKSGVADRFLEDYLNGHLLKVFCSETSLDLIHVDDVCRTIVELVAERKERGIINVGTGRKMTTGQLAHYFKTKHHAQCAFEDSEKGWDHSVLNVNKLRRLGIDPDKFIRVEDYIDGTIEDRRKSGLRL